MYSLSLATDHLIGQSCILQTVESEHLLKPIAAPSEVPGEFLIDIVVCILLFDSCLNISYLSLVFEISPCSQAVKFGNHYLGVLYHF